MEPVFQFEKMLAISTQFAVGTSNERQLKIRWIPLRKKRHIYQAPRNERRSFVS